MKYYNKNWSAELENYKNGNQSETERFQLEKSALDDSFLFDALEGYSTTASAKRDTRKPQRAAKENATIFSIRNIAVAASLVILIGVVGYMKTQLGENNSDKKVVAVGQESESDRTQIAMHEKSPHTVEGEQQKSPSEQQGIINDNPVELKKEDKRKTDSNPVAVYRTPEKSESEKSEPVARDADESLDELKNSKKVTNDNKRKSKLNIGGPNGSLKMGNGQKTTLDGVKILSRDIEPVMGWKSLEKYIEQNKKKIASLKNITVLVSFVVNADGTISNVQANKTSCSACEKDAIDIIRGSGLWSNKKGKPQNSSYEIHY